jgi:hypothetical protein
MRRERGQGLAGEEEGLARGTTPAKQGIQNFFCSFFFFLVFLLIFLKNIYDVASKKSGTMPPGNCRYYAMCKVMWQSVKKTNGILTEVPSEFIC